jgi:hypothetical protein
VELVQNELSGSETTIAHLEELKHCSEATALTISGREQNALEYLCERFAKQFAAIHFWKCQRVKDLSALKDLQPLTQVAFCWNK